MKPFVFTEEEELDLAASHIVSDNKRLVELTKWLFVKEWRGMNCTNVTAKMVHDVALRYRRTLPRAVRDELSAFAMPIKKKQEERRRLQDELQIKLLAYKHGPVFRGAYKGVKAQMQEIKLYKRWAVLLINEAQTLFKKKGFKAPRVTVDFFKSIAHQARYSNGISIEQDGGYTIHVPVIDNGIDPFSINIPRWNGRIAAYFEPSHMSRTTFLDIVIENGSPRLILVRADFGQLFSPYRTKYVFQGISDLEFLDVNGSPVKKTRPTPNAAITVNSYPGRQFNRSSYKFSSE